MYHMGELVGLGLSAVWGASRKGGGGIVPSLVPAVHSKLPVSPFGLQLM